MGRKDTALADHPKETYHMCFRAALAEFIASAVFVFISCGTAMSGQALVKGAEGAFDPTATGMTHLRIALAFGFAIFILAFSIGHISGGHINPAVTITLVALQYISVKRAFLYFCSQLFGMLVGVGFLKALTPAVWFSGSCFGATTVNPDIDVGLGFGAEIILTFILVFVVMAASDSNKSNQILVPLGIGMAVFVAHLVGVPLTGCGINPTRSFASAVISAGIPECDAKVWTHHWIYWVGPILGGLLAGGVYTFTLQEDDEEDDNLEARYRKSKNASLSKAALEKLKDDHAKRMSEKSKEGKSREGKTTE